MTVNSDNHLENDVNNTWVWHGTGRFQYDSSGQIIDVLRSILSQGGLLPLVKDPWLKIEGDFQYSISVAKIRAYSRIYADTMQYDQKEITYHYFSSRFWFWLIGIAHVVKHPLSVITHLAKLQLKKASNHQLNDLILKYRKPENIKKRIFLLKLLNMPSTDINDNYGIIIGIRNVSNLCYEMNNSYSLFEHRLRGLIPVSQFTYIEAPAKRVEQTRKILNDYQIVIPVYPIESVEKFFAQKGLLAALKTNN